MKKSMGLSATDFDRSVRPQDDFFHFAGGGWLKKNPIPDTESSWSRFHKLRQDVLKQCHTILEDLAKRKNVAPGSNEQLVGDFYRSGMDMKTRNRLGLTPLSKTLEQIERIQTHADLFDFLFREQARGNNELWGHFVGQDDKDNTKYIFHLYQGSLTLPDRDYYLKNDARSRKIRGEFIAYAKKLLVLSGTSREEAALQANAIVKLETKLARIMMSRADSRDIKKTYNKMTVAQLKKTAYGIPWGDFFKTLGVDKKVRQLIVTQPAYLKKLGALLNTVPVSAWKTYLRFSAIDDSAPTLSQEYIDLSFSFHGKTLSGSKVMRPLWKRVTATLEHYIGEAVGKEYVARHFPPEAKKKINALVDDLMKAYEGRIKSLDWMSEKTKKRALKKLRNMSRKLGYPDTWKSYRGLVIQPDTYFENIERAEAFEHKKNLARLGKKVNRKEWFTPPQTVNAYCDQNNNEIVFPAGILQSPFFGPHLDDAMNYGCMGSIIGHEMTHSFDETGSEFDENANYRTWWTTQDRQRFKKRTALLVKQFNEYTVDGHSVNGKLTLSENIADLGGLEIGFDALKLHMKNTPLKTVGGFTPEQRYFLGLAMFETEHSRPETRHMRLMTDTHSPGIYRVNGPYSNMDSFHDVWGLKRGDKLYRAPQGRAKIW